MAGLTPCGILNRVGVNGHVERALVVRGARLSLDGNSGESEDSSGAHLGRVGQLRVDYLCLWVAEMNIKSARERCLL